MHLVNPSFAYLSNKMKLTGNLIFIFCFPFYENSSRLAEVDLNRIIKKNVFEAYYLIELRKCRLVSKETTTFVFTFLFILYSISWMVHTLAFVWEVDNLKCLSLHRVSVIS